jgi:hypothetical protein
MTYDPTRYGGIIKTPASTTPIITETKKETLVEPKKGASKIIDLIEGTIVTGGNIFGGMHKVLKPTAEVGAEVLKSFGAKSVMRIGADILHKPIETPFGLITPSKETSKKEQLLDMANLASSLPMGAQKTVVKGAITPISGVIKGVTPVIKGGLKYASKIGERAVETVGEALTGVEQVKLDKWVNLARNFPKKLEEYKEAIKLNPKNPLMTFAKNLSNKIGLERVIAEEKWKKAKEIAREKYGDIKLDISYNFKDQIDYLNKFLNEYGLKIETVEKAGKTIAGIAKQKITDYVVKPVHKLSQVDENIPEIQKFVNLISNATDLTIDEINFFRGKIDEIYNSVKYSVDGKAKPFHRLIMELREPVEEMVQRLLPEELKEANIAYRRYYDLYQNFGKYITEFKNGIATTKATAEQFLSNLVKKNKGIIAERSNKEAVKLGEDLLNEIENYKIAEELSKNTPKASQDIILNFVRTIAGQRGFMGLSVGATMLKLVRPEIGIPIFMVQLLSSPKRYSKLLEAMAGARNIINPLKELSPTEIFLLQKAFLYPITKGEE